MDKDRRQRSYEEAQKYVREVRDFYGHLIAYICVNGFLFALNMVTSPGNWWFYWPMLGWGIGLSIHAFNTFGVMRYLGKDWEEDKIRKLMGDKEYDSYRMEKDDEDLYK